ncbi:hypothetical protein ACJIZ3_021380 [Penstemon smallii]|uniref:Nuclear transcription factor Y subunit n=1 Tax=Penstemon smallii TaxID=265156 RepID=A0ABD3SL81_9LAMI
MANFHEQTRPPQEVTRMSLSYHDLTAMENSSSQDQCPSSDSIQEDGNHGPQAINVPIVPFQYVYADPYLSDIYTAYGAHAMIQSQLRCGAASNRVQLPAYQPEDSPIYVNAKQYNAILRRRKARAKLEAQNKLLKSRKPYMHESRHKHAVNRVRGSGGRFLSKKEPQDSDSNPIQKADMLNANEHRLLEGVSTTEGTQVSSNPTHNGNRHYASNVR